MLDTDPRIDPSSVRTVKFPGSSRRYDARAVDDYLRALAARVAATNELVDDLQRRLDDAERQASAPARRPELTDLTEDELLSLVGAETAAVLASARNAAAEIRSKAEDAAGRVVRESTEQARTIVEQAQREAATLRAEAENAHATAFEAAERAAAHITEAARTEAAKILSQARGAADAELAGVEGRRAEAREEATRLVADAREEGRQMVGEAREVRARMLADLEARRQAITQEITELSRGRDELVDAYAAVQSSLDAIQHRLRSAGVPTVERGPAEGPASGPAPATADAPSVLVDRADFDAGELDGELDDPFVVDDEVLDVVRPVAGGAVHDAAAGDRGEAGDRPGDEPITPAHDGGLAKTETETETELDGEPGATSAGIDGTGDADGAAPTSDRHPRDGGPAVDTAADEAAAGLDPAPVDDDTIPVDDTVPALDAAGDETAASGTAVDDVAVDDRAGDDSTGDAAVAESGAAESAAAAAETAVSDETAVDDSPAANTANADATAAVAETAVAESGAAESGAAESAVAAAETAVTDDSAVADAAAADRPVDDTVTASTAPIDVAGPADGGAHGGIATDDTAPSAGDAEADAILDAGAAVPTPADAAVDGAASDAATTREGAGEVAIEDAAEDTVTEAAADEAVADDGAASDGGPAGDDSIADGPAGGPGGQVVDLRRGADEGGAGADEPARGQDGVDALFARLRADRDATRVPSTPSSTAGASAGGVSLQLVDEPDEHVADAHLVPEPLVIARHEAMAGVAQGLDRAIKRQLADEQNVVLDQVRRGDFATVEALYGELGGHLARYRSVVSAALGQVADVAATAAGGAGTASVQPLSEALASALVVTFRGRVLDAIDDADGDGDALDRQLRLLYREWKAQRVGPAVEDSLLAAHAAGVLAGTDAGTPVRWAIDPDQGPCPDAVDNALAGSQPVGTPFPTGDVCPQAHPGCRCMLVAD